MNDVLERSFATRHDAETGSGLGVALPARRWKIVYKRVYTVVGFTICWKDVVEITLVEYTWPGYNLGGQYRILSRIASSVGSA